MNSWRRVLFVIALIVATACGTVDDGNDTGALPSAQPSVAASVPAATATQVAEPTLIPTPEATQTVAPSVTAAPTVAPSATLEPTLAPSATMAPTAAPSFTAAPLPTLAPTASPAPTQAAPTASTVLSPTAAPDDTATAVAETGVAAPGNDATPHPELAGKIAFVRGADAWLLRPGIGEQRELLKGTVDFRWSPDGGSIAFVRTDGLYLADGEGGNEQRIYEGTDVSAPTWAPDGSKIAWTRGPAAQPAREVWVYDHVSNEARRIATGSQPAWAPDSQRIAYVSPTNETPPRRNELHVVNWQGQNDWLVVSKMPPNTPPIGIPNGQVDPADLEHIMETPVWSSDGRSIYVASYVLYQVLTDFYIWERADAINGSSTFLSELPGNTATPSPSRVAVLYSSTSARGDSWFVARVLGEQNDQWRWAETENGGSSFAPAWAPDSRAVAYYACAFEQPGACSLKVRTPTGEINLLDSVLGGPTSNPWGVSGLDWSRDD